MIYIKYTIRDSWGIVSSKQSNRLQITTRIIRAVSTNHQGATAHSQPGQGATALRKWEHVSVRVYEMTQGALPSKHKLRPKGKVVPYSITSKEMIPVSWQSESHKPVGRLPLLFTRPAVTFPPSWPVPNYIVRRCTLYKV